MYTGSTLYLLVFWLHLLFCHFNMDEHTIDLHRSIVYTKNAVYRFK